MKTSLLLSTLSLLASPLAIADTAQTELFQSETCQVTSQVLVLQNKQKVNVTGAQQAYRLTFADGAIVYKLDLIYGYQLSVAETGQSVLDSEQLVLTRAATEPGANANEKIVTQSMITYSVPTAGGDMTTDKSTKSFRETQKDANTLLAQDLTTDKTQKSPDTLQTTKTSAPGVQTITSKTQGPNPAQNGLQVLSNTLACAYAPASEDVMPGTDFYAAVPSAVDQFRAQMTATMQAEAAAASCKTDGTSCEQLERAAYDSIQARDDLWGKLFQ